MCEYLSKVESLEPSSLFPLNLADTNRSQLFYLLDGLLTNIKQRHLNWH